MFVNGCVNVTFDDGFPVEKFELSLSPEGFVTCRGRFMHDFVMNIIDRQRHKVYFINGNRYDLRRANMTIINLGPPRDNSINIQYKSIIIGMIRPSDNDMRIKIPDTPANRRLAKQLCVDEDGVYYENWIKKGSRWALEGGRHYIHDFELLPSFQIMP